MKVGILGIILAVVSSFLCWWHHCDWWFIGIVCGLAIQAFALAYLCDEKE